MGLGTYNLGCAGFFERYRTKYCYVFLLWVFFPLAYAQKFNTTVQTEALGMPSSTAWDTVQDDQGLLWVVTRQGLATFDGADWQEIAPPTNVQNTSFHQIERDSKGNLWLATNLPEKPVYMYDGKHWHTMPPLPYAPDAPKINVRLAIIETDGSPMLGYVLRGNLFFLQKKQWFFHGNQKSELGDVTDIKSGGSHFLLATSKGLFRSNGYTHKNLMPPNTTDRERDLLALCQSQDPGTYHLLGKHYIATLSNGQYKKIRLTPAFYDEEEINRYLIFEDRNRSLLFGNHIHLLHLSYPDRNIKRLGQHNGLTDIGATHIFHGRENGLWIGNLRGMVRIHQRQFTNYSRADKLRETEVSAIHEWKPGKLLLGHNQGITLMDENGFRPIHLEGLAGKGRIFEFQNDYIEGVLCAVVGAGIVALDDNLNARILPSERSSTPLYSVQRDRRGKLWAGGPKGLFEYDEGVFKLYAKDISPVIQVRRIQLYSDGLALSTFQSGIYLRQKNGKWRNYRSKQTSGNNIYTVYENTNGDILVGTQAGLMTIKDGTLVFSSELPVSRSVYFIMQDKKDRHWVGTSHGIYRFGGGNARHYTPANGLSALETNRGAHLQATDGTFWFGTASGLSHYQEVFDLQPVPPIIDLVGAHNSVEPIDLSTPVNMSYENNLLSIQVKATTMVERKLVWISTFLEGYEETWSPKKRIESGNIHYHDLSPGHYTFKVKALANGAWSDVLSSQTITVETPYWRKLWFLVSVALLCIFIGYAMFDYLTHRKASQFLQLQVDERTYELTQKNQMLEDKIQELRTSESKIQALNEDLEERVRQRTAELEATQKDLVENAHYAGMAEIATSMLHNVGNVLNSISTSGFLLKETLEHSKLPSLLRANQLLSEHIDDFDTFLQESSKGKDLLRFFLSVGNKMDAEHIQLNDQLKLLLEKIDMIKDVVSQQHNYTSGVYQTEIQSVNHMVKTALKILDASLVAKGIQLETNLGQIPRVFIQKTKMVHTLVNLIKNAAEAMMERETRILTITSKQVDDSVRLTIRDTGTGIPVENLQKIFNHGFTTKEEGHGFGLHSCANAMQEMSGKLTAGNRTDREGAIFTLIFPIPEDNETRKGNPKPDAEKSPQISPEPVPSDASMSDTSAIEESAETE